VNQKKRKKDKQENIEDEKKLEETKIKNSEDCRPIRTSCHQRMDQEAFW